MIYKSLMISDLIIPGNLAKELTLTLGTITEITGSLTVSASTGLLTLYFLHSLKKIGTDNNEK